MDLKPIDKPTKWPNANARLLGKGLGLPINPLDRLALFSADEFERFVLEWANGYLRAKVAGVSEVQQRGGAGDKGRDIVVWFGAAGSTGRHWHLYQCKRYNTALGPSSAVLELGKILYHVYASGDLLTLPSEYWFVTHKGVTGTLQDLVDNPAKLKEYLISNWENYCSTKITAKSKIPLDGELLNLIQETDFGFVRVKQPLQLLDEHKTTQYHSLVFGSALVDRPPPPDPPSAVAAEEQVYISQLFSVIGEMIDKIVNSVNDFKHHPQSEKIYSRSRICFYNAEGLKELARDNMEHVAFFDDLLDDFYNGLYYYHTSNSGTGLQCLIETIKAAQSQQIAGHVLEPLMTSLDREGICHHLANVKGVSWCSND